MTLALSPPWSAQLPVDVSSLSLTFVFGTALYIFHLPISIYYFHIQDIPIYAIPQFLFATFITFSRRTVLKLQWDAGQICK